MSATNLYALLESRPGHPDFGEPFYVGIGGSKRPARHIREARSKAGHRNWRLHEILAAHFLAGIEPTVRVLAVCPDKEFAGILEKRAIAVYGRAGIDPDGGKLANIASGGQGPDADLMRLPEIRQRNSAAQKRRPRESFENLIAAGLANAKDPIINGRRSAATSAANKLSWATADVSNKRIAGMRGKAKETTGDAIAARRANLERARMPGSHEKHANAMQQMWERPERVTKQRLAQASAWQDTEKRANMLAGRSEGVANSWTDPEVRARRIAGIKAAAARRAIDRPRQGTGVGRSETMRALNAAKTDEDRSAEQRDLWADPEVRQRRIDGLKKAAQDPELRARRVAAMLEGKRRKAAERAAAASSDDGDRAGH